MYEKMKTKKTELIKQIKIVTPTVARTVSGLENGEVGNLATIYTQMKNNANKVINILNKILNTTYDNLTVVVLVGVMKKSSKIRSSRS